MKRIHEWAIVFSLAFIVTSLVAFFNSYFVDAAMLALYATSAIFFLMTPEKKKRARWNHFELISYLLFISGFAVSMFKFFFMEINPL